MGERYPGFVGGDAYVSMRQHTSAYVSIRRRMSWSGRAIPKFCGGRRIRQHTSAYVSMRQHKKADKLEWESDTQVLWGETLPELACYLHL